MIINQQNRNNEFHQGEKRGFSLPFISSNSSISIDTSKEKDISKKLREKVIIKRE